MNIENYDQREEEIKKVLKKYNIKDLNEAQKLSKDLSIDIYKMVKDIQKIF